jgi:superfamily I DNA/RNA helicase
MMVNVVDYKVFIDGAWDIDDLSTFSEAFKETYAYFYWIHPSTLVDDSTRSRFQRYFWSADFVGRQFAQDLYYRIPVADRLNLKSIQYASPGLIEFAGGAGALALIAHSARAFVKLGSEFLDLLEKVRKFFRESRLERPPKRIDGDSVTSAKIEAATGLAFELGILLGMSNYEIEHLINLTGSPISTLKLLVSLATESGKLSTLEEHGKIRLSELPLVTLGQTGRPNNRGQRTRGGVLVERRKSRKRKK